MPQMSAMNWSLLFVIFMATFMTMFSKIYFNTYFEELDIKPFSFSLKLNNKFWLW